MVRLPPLLYQLSSNTDPAGHSRPTQFAGDSFRRSLGAPSAMGGVNEALIQTGLKERDVGVGAGVGVGLGVGLGDGVGDGLGVGDGVGFGAGVGVGVAPAAVTLVIRNP